MNKKYILPILGAVSMFFSFSSCKKCKDCTFLTETEEVCEADFDSKEEYESYIALIEAFGGNCK